MKYVLFSLLLLGCAPGNLDSKQSTEVDGVQRFYDNTLNVVCYRLYTHSISCVSLPAKYQGDSK